MVRIWRDLTLRLTVFGIVWFWFFAALIQLTLVIYAKEILDIDSAFITGELISTKLVSLVGAIFILPFVLFSNYAGYFADVYNKRRVLIVTKFLEIIAMGLAFLLLPSWNLVGLFIVLFLMATQSTFLSPAKYGIIPEMVKTRDITRTNGLMEMATFVAIIFGLVLGGILYDLWGNSAHLIGFTLVAIAFMGWISLFRLTPVPDSGASKEFSFKPWSEIAPGMVRIWRDLTLRLTVFGIVWFWFFAALIQLTLVIYAKEILDIDSAFITSMLYAYLAIGVAFGGLSAGLLSGDKIELGLVPLGAIGITFSSIYLYFAGVSAFHYIPALILLGLFGGLFIVPLNATVQYHTSREEKGRVIATSNFLQTVAILVASGILPLLHDVFFIKTHHIILIFGSFTAIVTLYACYLLPQLLVRLVLWMFTQLIYRIKIVGEQNIPRKGPALLIANHVSYVDGFLISACFDRPVRFLIAEEIYRIRYLKWLFKLMKAIPVRSGKGLIKTLEEAQQLIKQGEVVCVFAEGMITRIGQLLPFKKGFEKIVEHTKAPIIPIYLHGVWGSLFSFSKGRFFFKKPISIPYSVSLSFGKALPSDTSHIDVRYKIQELSAEIQKFTRKPYETLSSLFIKAAKKTPFKFALADASGQELSYLKVLSGSLLLARKLKSYTANQSRVGILLPPSVGGALVNLALAHLGKVLVNLNYSLPPERVLKLVQKADIHRIVTSRKFIAKLDFPDMAEMIYIEDLVSHISTFQKVFVSVLSFILPQRSLLKVLQLKPSKTTDCAVLLFSSGTTGDPKGIQLSHHNIISNIESINQVLPEAQTPTFMGVLPFFHAFGLTGTLFLPLLTNRTAVYHTSPLEAKKIGKMIHKYNASYMINTPTFYKLMLKSCTENQLQSLKYAVVGAEKLQSDLAALFEEKFNITLLEGYGCTELSPVVSVNLPDFKSKSLKQIGLKKGSAGHPLPNIVAKVVNPDKGDEMKPGEPGLLLIKGQNVMMGYLNDEKRTSSALKNGWYVTGDIAKIDAEGFITIVDRLERFSKIGGEMVPHLAIEEEVIKVIKSSDCAIVSIPSKKGEELFLYYASEAIQPHDLFKELNASGLPKLWLPKESHMIKLSEIPFLGAGKIDFQKLKALASFGL